MAKVKIRGICLINKQIILRFCTNLNEYVDTVEDSTNELGTDLTSYKPNADSKIGNLFNIDIVLRQKYNIVIVIF